MPSAVHPNAPLCDGVPLVLIVEDSRIQAAMLRQLLQKNGCEAMVAPDGARALEMAAERRPTIVISDILMPVMDGYQTCRAFKSAAELRDIPVILLTSLSDPLDIVEGLQAGADYYLTKPYDDKYLVSMIQSIVSKGLPVERSAQEDMEVVLEGHTYFIGAGRRQMLNLLLSTYSNAVIQNRLLLHAQAELRTVNSKLEGQRAQIEAQGRELREVNEVLRHQATRDSLTGLRNFRAFTERMSEEIERSHRRAEPLSLLLVDVDFFKQFNDTFGHPAGDEVLRSVAKLMESQARGCDFVGRYGGEEFAILLPGTDEDAAHLVAERVRAAIECGPWTRRVITVSIGIATVSGENPGLESAALLTQADCALYASKAAGRNQVSHFKTCNPQGKTNPESVIGENVRDAQMQP